MPQIVTGFDRYAQEARALREEKRRASMDAAAETRAVAQEGRQQTQFELAKQDRQTSLANEAEDRANKERDRFLTAFGPQIATAATVEGRVPLDLFDTFKVLVPEGKAAGAQYGAVTQNEKGEVTGIDYYANEADPEPIYQQGLDAVGLLEKASGDWSVYESKVTRDEQNNLTANTVMVNKKGDSKVVKTPLGKDTPTKGEKEQTEQQKIAEQKSTRELLLKQAEDDTQQALRPVGFILAAAGVSGIKDPYEAEGQLDALIAAEKDPANLSVLKIAKRRIAAILDTMQNPATTTPTAPGKRTGGGGTFDVDSFLNEIGLPK